MLVRKGNTKNLSLKLLLLLFGTPCLLHAARITKDPKLNANPINHFDAPFITAETSPWFTGPLLASSPHVVPGGHYDIEPYLFFNTTTGSYNKNWRASSSPNFYSVSLQAPTWFGLTSFMDFSIAPQVTYQYTQGQDATEFGDLPFAFDFQLLNEVSGSWFPAIKLGVFASVPIGKYDHLNPSKLGTDDVGSGSWQPGVNLVFGRLFQTVSRQFLATRLAFTYVVPTPVHVKDLNTYGGTKGTRGTVYPGNDFATDLGLEYTLSKQWAFALDAVYAHSNKTRFKGTPGEVSPGVPAVMTSRSSESFSLAPAIEYNLNINMGLITGVWFSVSGRNANRFANAVIAFNIFI